MKLSRSTWGYATLKPAEEKVWEIAFAHHVITGKQGQDKAAARAWKDLQRQFPRLRKYQGARP